MLLSPEDLAKQYLNVRVDALVPYFSPPILCAGTGTFAIDQYRSGFSSYRNSVRMKITKFLADQAALGGTGIVADQDWSLPYLQIDPIYSLSADATKRVFTGRGSVWEIQSILRIATLMMMSYNTKTDFLGATDLPTFIKWFIGMDCNGFVGNYLRAAVGGDVKLASTVCSSLAAGTKRSKAEEIREGDFIYYDRKTDHISIVGTVKSTPDKDGYIHCNICEARSYDFGGVQILPWKIKRNGDAWKMYRTDMTGLPVTGTWIARHPLLA